MSGDLNSIRNHVGSHAFFNLCDVFDRDDQLGKGVRQKSGKGESTYICRPSKDVGVKTDMILRDVQSPLD